MFRVAVRVWLLWGVVTLIANWWFGFNQWVRLWELVEVSRPQVEAFWQGITSIGWRELLVMPFVFIYRRAIFYFLRRARILVFKKGAAFIAFVLLEKHWREMLLQAMSMPRKYARSGMNKVKTWREIDDYLVLRPWFLYLYTALVLTLGTFLWAELLLALIRGTLALPPIVVRYQTQAIAFAVAFVVATIAQSFLLSLWDTSYHRLPEFVHAWLHHVRFPLLRHMVHFRAFCRMVFGTVFTFQRIVFCVVCIMVLCTVT